MANRSFGHIPGVSVGATFANRNDLAEAGVHRPRMAGISYSEGEGADSIVVSGGYEDDEDQGDLIIYTGHGGNDPVTGRQIADQQFTRGNLALARNADEGLPVRVTRGARGDPRHSPPSGYRYHGLYSVERYWPELGRSGFRIYRYRLLRLHDPVTSDGSAGTGTPPRATVTTQRIVRNTTVTQWVKGQHQHTCQVCGLRLVTPSGPYAEGSHIRPLGRPHDGPDTPDNVLCLCPNDHVRFDTGAIYISDNLRVVDSATGDSLGPLRVAPEHGIDIGALSYHRLHSQGLGS